MIVDAITTRVRPKSAGVTVYSHPSDPRQPFAQDDTILGIQKEPLPQSSLISIRVGEEGMPAPVELKE